jgi:hypothetical protein
VLDSVGTSSVVDDAQPKRGQHARRLGGFRTAKRTIKKMHTRSLSLAACTWGLALSIGCAQEATKPSRVDVERPDARRAITPAGADASPSPPPIGEAPDGAVGTAHPILFQAASADGLWVAFCQARTDTDADGQIAVRLGTHGEPAGDAMTLYLAQRGQESAIEDLVDADPTGRFLTVVRGARLVLVDALSRTEVDLSALGADARDDGDPTRKHRAASFDASGSHLLYMRGEDGAAQVVVRDLATGGETTHSPGPGKLWRASFGEGDAWIVLEVVVADTDHDGKLEWPSLRTSLAGRHCRGRAMSATFAGRRGDEPVTRVLPTSGGVARDLPDLVRPLGDRLLRRAPTGALVIDDPRTGAREIASATCKGKLVAADAPSGAAIVVCGDPDRVGPVLVAGGAQPRSLGFSVYGPRSDQWSTTTGSIARIEKGTGTFRERVPSFYDFRTGTLVDLHAGDQVLASYGAFALVSRAPVGSATKRGLLSFDVAHRAERPLNAEVDPIAAHAVGNGGILAVSAPDAGTSPVIDLVRGVLVGSVHGNAVAVASNAGQPTPWTRVLVASAEARARAPLPVGPLRWVEPVVQ